MVQQWPAGSWTACSPDVTLSDMSEGTFTFEARLAGIAMSEQQHLAANFTIYRTPPTLQVRTPLSAVQAAVSMS